MANPELTAAVSSLSNELEALSNRIDGLEASSEGPIVPIVEHLSEVVDPQLGQFVITTGEPATASPPSTWWPTLWCYSPAFTEYNNDPNNVFPPNYHTPYPEGWKRVATLNAA